MRLVLATNHLRLGGSETYLNTKRFLVPSALPERPRRAPVERDRELRAARRGAERIRDHYESTLSWRLTRPLRAARRLLRLPRAGSDGEDR